MKGTTNSQRGTGGGGEKLVISLKTNQTSHEDLIGAKFSVVINGNATEYTWQGASMTIPVTPMLNYTVEFGEVEGYAKPEPITHTAVAGNDRFVIGIYNTELVTVNVSAEEGEVSGYEIQIISDGNVLYTQTTSSATYKIPYGTSYTVKASGVSGYTTPTEQLFTASQPTRNVDVTYSVAIKGIFIQDIYGRLYTEDEWDGTQTANGIAVLADECGFVVAKEDAKSSYVYWGGTGTDISTLTNYSDDSSAPIDFDGVNNTSKIIAAIGNSSDGNRSGSAAGDCRDYIFSNGEAGYLGAAGEWRVARQNKDALNSALTLIGGTVMTEDAYWTSTEFNSSFTWRQWFDSSSSLVPESKYDGNYVRAFAPYIANPKIISFTIAGTTYQCWEGTIWKQWVLSAFNEAGFVYENNRIEASNGKAVCETNVDIEIDENSPIIENYNYSLINVPL